MSRDTTDRDAPSELERARFQREYGRLQRTTEEERIRQRIGQRQRDSEVLFVFPDSNRHERRIQRAVPSRHDRLFWITIAVACGSPGRAADGAGPGDNVLAKEFGHLELARNDLEAFYEYYRPMQIGNPLLVTPALPGLAKSPGYFDSAVRLDNPTVAQLRASAEGLRAWLAVNQHDPEYSSFQLNFIFSGHGDVEGGSVSIVLADQKLPVSDLAIVVLTTIPPHEMVPVPTEKSIWHAQHDLTGVDHSLALSRGAPEGITPTRRIRRRCLP